ncbi:MAG TPA: GNAT family N-acetyltransferase [Acidobacteriota bacterium]|nr:GNAT family N-acetyltransferase [Acidobacteriota bacterium]
MAWKNDRWPQGCASSALGFILAPSQKAAGLVRFRGLGKCRNSRARLAALTALCAAAEAQPVRRFARGQGLGEALLRALIDCSEQAGIWTLQGSTFPENTASLRLQERCGFRVVGRRERISRHHGIWRATILTERRSSIAGRD